MRTLATRNTNNVINFTPKEKPTKKKDLILVDNIDIAFCHNDLGNFSRTPKLKEHGQTWAAKCIIKGGYMLSNNNFNRAKVKNIEIMEENGFTNTDLLNLENEYDLTELPIERKEGYMLSHKE